VEQIGTWEERTLLTTCRSWKRKSSEITWAVWVFVWKTWKQEKKEEEDQERLWYDQEIPQLALNSSCRRNLNKHTKSIKANSKQRRIRTFSIKIELTKTAFDSKEKRIFPEKGFSHKPQKVILVIYDVISDIFNLTICMNHS